MFVLLGAALPAQTPSWSPDWAVAGLGGTVLAFADFQAELHAGGEWFAAKGGPIRGLARFDGVDWQPIGSGIDLVNYSFPPRDTQIAAMTVWNGELVFAGTFDQVDGQPMQSIARWNGTSFAPLGQGLSLSYDEAEVRALVVFQNELYAAGEFDTAGGAPAAGIARWNGTSWSPVGTGLRRNNGTTVGYPRALHVHGGALVAAGEFDRAGSSVVANIARWNGTAWSAMGAGSFAPVYALETFGTQLVAAGQFATGAGVAMPGAWNGASWGALGSNAPALPSTSLRTFGGHLYADSGGLLSRCDGATWSPCGVVTGIFNGFQGTSIRALHVHGSDLVIGGQFTRAGSSAQALAVASANVVAYDGGTAWRTLGSGMGLDRGPTRILPWRSGWVAAGPFSEAGGAPAVGLAFHDGDRWQTLGRFSGGSGGQLVYDVAVFQGDVVVTGAFGSIDGQPFPGIARFDGAAWQPFGSFGPLRLHVHGSALYACGGSALLRWNGTAFVAVATASSGSIGTLHTHQDGSLYATNNDAFNHRVLRWNGAQLQSIGSGNDFVQTLGSHGSHLIAGGRFTNFGGVAATLLARWNGVAWSAMPAPVSGYAAYSLCELDGDLFAGVSGDPRGSLLRLHNGAWQGLGSGTDGVPTMLFADRTVASVLAAGDLLTAGGLPSRSVAEWRTQPDWRNRLHGLAGGASPPLLRGRGAAQAGSPLEWTAEGSANGLAILCLGLSRIDVPLFGGVLVPMPDVLLPLALDSEGSGSFAMTLLASTPPGMDLWSQAWVLDAAGPQGFTATNALQCTTR